MAVDFEPHELWSEAARRDRHAFYARVRAAGEPVPQIDPVTGKRFWVLARHADVRSGLRHPDIGHEVHRHQTGPAAARSRVPVREADRLGARQLISLDPPDHTRLRGFINTAFTPRTVARLETRIEALVDGLLADARRRGTVDGVGDLGDPVPVAIIADLIGIPPEDRERFRAWSAMMISGGTAWAAATGQFAAYLDDLAAKRRADPRDDLLSALVALQIAGDSLDRDELVAMIQLLLVAGQETTVDLIANGILALLSNPDQWQLLKDDPSLAAAAVEEIIRYDGPVEIAPPRYTFQLIEIGGGVIPPFEIVALSVLGADRDPEVFTDPDVFDIKRSDAKHHIGFGHGIHFCLGAPLARLEGRIMFEKIAQQLPDLRLLAEPDQVRGVNPRLTALPLAV
ncbi:cytochrome P450 family protein [Rugosimonospora africana]|uniref:Cytochrome P450 hydroxylase n=1 Tax=Rugosimonospora africana TaxID=556532 RepID=A0A8J3QTE8_9ACTN|nr:cytochrome P450 [Rugosimonospora africana]GIH16744.1 cytochrome P450 hydroxylase [Rugosimonospora africana]